MLENYGISADALLFLQGILIASAVVGIIIYFILAASYAKIFKKYGENGVKGYIPIYNLCVLMKIVDMNQASILLLFIPIANLFLLALLSVKVANKFNKGAGFALGLLFVPFICYPVLAFQNTEKPEKIEIAEIIEKTENAFTCKNCGTELEEEIDKCFICDEPVAGKTEIDVVKEAIVEKQTEEIKEDNNSFSFNREEEILLGEGFEEPISVEASVETSFLEVEVPAVASENIQDDQIFEENQDVKEENDLIETLSLDTEESPKYKSSTKTLDEILKINNDFYAPILEKKEEETVLETADIVVEEPEIASTEQIEVVSKIEKNEEEETNNFEDIYKDLLKGFASVDENKQKDYIETLEETKKEELVTSIEEKEEVLDILSISNSTNEVAKETSEELLFEEIKPSIEDTIMNEKSSVPNTIINNDTKEFIPLVDVPEVPLVTEDLSDENSIDIETISKEYLKDVEEDFEIQDKYQDDEDAKNLELETLSRTAAINVDEIMMKVNKDFRVEDIDFVKKEETKKEEFIPFTEEKEEFSLEAIELDKIEEI